MAGRKEWYEWNSGKWNGPPMMMEGANANTHSQEIPHKWTSHVPKAAPEVKTQSDDSTHSATKEENKGIEKIMAKLQEILRYQKRMYDIRSVWRGFVKTEDILATQPMKELKARSQDIEWETEKNRKHSKKKHGRETNTSV